MKRLHWFLGRAVLIVILALTTAGCSAVHTSRIVLDSWGRMPDGTAVWNFTVDEVDSFVRSFALQKGYEVKFADGSYVWAGEETAGNDSSLLWIAEKKDEPVILFISTEDELIVTVIETLGLFRSPLFREYTNVIYRMLADKFGEEYVHLIY